MAKNEVYLSKDYIRFVLDRYIQGIYGATFTIERKAVLEYAHLINAISKSEFDHLMNEIGL